MAIDKYTLKLRQAMPLKDKIRFTERRIHEWVEHFGVNGCYISFSGGKVKTVWHTIFQVIYAEKNDYRDATEIKREHLQEIMTEFDIVAFIDDDLDNCEMAKELGIMALRRV